MNIRSFSNYVDEFHNFLNTITNPNKKEHAKSWTIKEVVGHLIDSACNNHRRFILVNENETVSFPGYEQDLWVKKADYNSHEYSELVRLWYLYNKVILRIVEQITNEKMSIIVGSKQYTIKEWVIDYYDHMERHNKQIKRILNS